MEPPSRAEIERAAKATLLGAALGLLMAALGRRRRV
jgi:MYXO-CTERM domain-containing protein